MFLQKLKFMTKMNTNNTSKLDCKTKSTLTLSKSKGCVQQAAAAEDIPPWYHKDVLFVGSIPIYQLYQLVDEVPYHANLNHCNFVQKNNESISKEKEQFKVENF